MNNMNNGNKIEQPYEGQKFKSFDALKKYLEEYGQKNFVKFWIRSSHTRNSLKSKISKTMNPDLKYVCVKFACIFGGEKIRFRGSGIRKSSTYRDLGCPCKINAVVGDDGNHVKLDTVNLEHNHVLSKALYDLLKKTKRKNQTIRNQKEFTQSNLMEQKEIHLDNGDISYLVFNENVQENTNCKSLLNLKNESKELPCQPENESENYLQSIKDKYGRNIKVLIVSSDNANTKFDGMLKSFRNEKNVIAERLLEGKNKICRLCLSSNDTLSPIFNPECPLKSTMLSFKIMGCASIEISSDDGLPNNICRTCEADLDIAYKFRIRCENSDSLLRKTCSTDDILCQTDNIILKENIENLVEDKSYSNEEGNSPEESTLICQEDENELASNKNEKDSQYIQFPITCPICNARSNTYEIMLEHLKTHSDNENILLACNMCNIICPTVKDLQEHMKDHLTEIKSDVYPCTRCERSFTTQEECRVHQDTHAESNQTKRQSDVHYLCNVCGKILKSKDRFRSHKNTHDGLRPHVCLKCGRGFADRKNMHHHYNVVHLRKSKLECPVCQKKFYTRTKMKSHVTMHYGVKPFACDVCNKTFRLKMNMIKHKKTHSNDRPHKCDKCSAAFIDKNMLKRHSYIHGGIRPYPCPVCGHRFSVKFHLKKHLEKSKCSARAVVMPEDYQWIEMTQPEVNPSENECLVVYKTSDYNVLHSGAEPITMDILQEYQDPNG